MGIGGSVSTRKIVVFKPEASDQRLQEAILRDLRAQIIKFLPLINGVAIRLLSEASVEELRAHPHVLRVSDDVLVRAAL